MYTDNDIMSLVLSEKSGHNDSKATPTDVIFMKCWRDIAASSRRSTLYQKKITDFVKKGQFINV
jgi:hypothetical protein